MTIIERRGLRPAGFEQHRSVIVVNVLPLNAMGKVLRNSFVSDTESLSF